MKDLKTWAGIFVAAIFAAWIVAKARESSGPLRLPNYLDRRSTNHKVMQTKLSPDWLPGHAPHFVAHPIELDDTLYGAHPLYGHAARESQCARIQAQGWILDPPSEVDL